MANPYFTDSLEPVAGSLGASQKIRTQFAAVEDAFDALEHVFTYQDIELNAANSFWIPVPWACDIVEFSSVVNNGTTDAVAVLTLEIATVPVTGAVLTIANPTAEGVYDESTAITALNSVAAGGTIEIVCDGGSTASVQVTVMITVKRTA